MITVRNVTKKFPGVTALNNVQFDLRPGEVHVLFGENGAGKSTLVNVLVGNLQPDSGSYMYDGAPVQALTPSLARKMGISAVFQEFSLAPSLSVLDNLFLGREPSRFGMTNRSEMVRRAGMVLGELQTKLPLDASVGSLSRAQKQQTEIAKALLYDARVLILDEPNRFFKRMSRANRVIELVRSLRKKGVGVIYISHRMREIKAVADRVTVLRNGNFVDTIDAKEISETRLVEMMTGKVAGALHPQVPHHPTATRLAIEHLSTQDGGVQDVSLSVRSGEIVGLAGLVGCGKSRIGRAVFGLCPLSGGTIKVDGQVVAPKEPRQMLRNGICYFPSDRVAEGLCMNRPISENITMADLDLPTFVRNGLLIHSTERRIAQSGAHRLKVLPPDIRRSVELLSGGNRQKVLLTRGLAREIGVYIFDEPTVGVDVGAKAEIYELMRELVENGAAVLLISSDLDEVVSMSHRICAIHAGELVAELRGEERTDENVLACFFGRGSNATGQLDATP